MHKLMYIQEKNNSNTMHYFMSNIIKISNVQITGREYDSTETQFRHKLPF